MKFRDPEELTEERARAGALSSTMRESLTSLASVRRQLVERLELQTSTWKEHEPHPSGDEDGFVHRMREVNALLQEGNESKARFHEEKQALNSAILENSKKKDEKLLVPLKRMNDIFQIEIETEIPRQFEILQQLDEAILKLEDFVSIAVNKK
jgi:hypothetical protein